MSVCNEKRERFEGSLITDQFVQHFQRFLGPNEKGNATNTQNMFTNKLSDEEALNMVADINDKEIKEAMFDIGENRAPGPDGHTSVFFKHSWDIVGYNCKNRPSRCALKIDIAKVYDIVNSDFLRNVLVKFGFHGNMVNWIMTCVCLAAFTIGINGLKSNIEKSVVFFGSVKEVIKKKILAILPFKVGKLPVKYLGIPLLAKKLGINDCKQLVDKVKCKIQEWKNRFLSYARKLQLIAVVLSTMQTY
nr:reverse transcriptase domain, reverse transcriptase zinc-binding domain protein [Tanacetum cinerariifolium]